jgi:hypothetical protein
MSDSIEDRALVEAYESSLTVHKSEFLDHCARVSEKYGQAGWAKLGCDAWPLRPLFIQRRKLEFISKTIHQQLLICKEKLLARAEEPVSLAHSLRFPQGLLERLNLVEGLTSPHYLSAVRPDGFMFPDRFVLSEYNLGSGLLATLTYTEVLHDLLAHGPVARHLQQNFAFSDRPFQSYARMLRNICEERSEPQLCLFSPKAELEELYSWEKQLFLQLFRAEGYRVTFADEDTLTIGVDDCLVHKETGETFDLLLQATTGEYFLDNPASLDDEHDFLRGAAAGSTPHVHPLSCLLLGKGALPARLAGEPCESEEKTGFRVEQDVSHFVEEEKAPHYRLNKDRYVLKRAWTGKDTVVGCSSGGRAWNRVVAEAMSSADFIIQEYCPLPKLDFPFLINDEIEFLPVRFELSPFIIRGDYSGALVRYAPDTEGVRLSPAPADLGMTVVCSTGKAL